MLDAFAFALLVFLVSCAGPAPQPSIASVAPRMEPNTPPEPGPTAAWTDGVPSRDAVRVTACEGFGPNCDVDRLSSAGASQDGTALYVARVLPDGPCPHPRVCAPLEPQPANVPGWDPVGGTYAFDPEACGDDIDECGSMGFVLVAARPTGAVTRLITEIMIWDQGAAGLGQDTIVIGNNSFSRINYGGSNERQLTATTIQLDPPAVLTRETEYAHMIFGGRTRVTWSEVDGRGFGFRENDACAARTPPATLVGVAIPDVALADEDAWRTTGFGDCAASMRREAAMPPVDTATGRIGPAPDASPDAPQVYRAGNALVLEVPRTTSSVTVWIGAELRAPVDCFELDARAVRVPVSGPPTQTRSGLVTERVVVGDRVRLRLSTAHGPPAAIDVGDFRTVAHGRGRPLVEGPFSWTPACEVRDGALHHEPRQPPDAPAALVGEEVF